MFLAHASACAAFLYEIKEVIMEQYLSWNRKSRKAAEAVCASVYLLSDHLVSL